MDRSMACIFNLDQWSFPSGRTLGKQYLDQWDILNENEAV